MWRVGAVCAVSLAVSSMSPLTAKAQASTLVSPSGTLPVTATLRSTAVALAVTVTEPGVLVPLEYHADRGWYLVKPLSSLALREPGKHTLRYNRWYGRLDVPPGTSNGFPPDVPNAGLGCAAARGVLDPATGHCGVGGSDQIGVDLDVKLGPGDYRGGLLWLPTGLSAAALDSALASTRGERPADALAQVARRLTENHGSVTWALVRVPRGG